MKKTNNSAKYGNPNPLDRPGPEYAAPKPTNNAPRFPHPAPARPTNKAT